LCYTVFVKTGRENEVTGRSLRSASARPQFMHSPGAEFVKAFNESGEVHAHVFAKDYGHGRFERIKAENVGFYAHGNDGRTSAGLHVNPRTGDTFVEAKAHSETGVYAFHMRDCTPEEEDLANALFAVWTLQGCPDQLSSPGAEFVKED
jgi:hypothetical protein